MTVLEFPTLEHDSDGVIPWPMQDGCITPEAANTRLARYYLLHSQSSACLAVVSFAYENDQGGGENDIQL